MRFVGCLTMLVALVGIVPESTSFAQSETPTKGRERGSLALPVEVHELFRGEVIPFSAPPAFMVASEMRCDLRGNIYLVYSDAPELVIGRANAISTLPISKLSLQSKSITEYAVPIIPHCRGVLRLDFDIDVSGNLYALLTALKEPLGKDEAQPAFFVAKYKDDGTMDSYFKVGQAPEGRIQPLRFAMFRDGNVLVAGTLVEGGSLRPFTAVLDRNGTFVTGIKLPHDVAPVPLTASSGGEPEGGGPRVAPSATDGGPRSGKRELAEPKGKANDSPVDAVSNGSLVSAPDGNVYLLRATDPPRLFVVSPAGEVVRQFEVQTPAPGLTPTDMGMVGDDRVFIRFTHIAATSADFGKGQDVITVLSPQTGELAAIYKLAAGESGPNLAACAASSYSFEFVGATDDAKHLQVAKYVPR